MDLFRFDVKSPKWFVEIFFFILALAASFLIPFIFFQIFFKSPLILGQQEGLNEVNNFLLTFGQNVILAGVVSVVLMITGLLSGYIWVFSGKLLTRVVLEMPLIRMTKVVDSLQTKLLKDTNIELPKASGVLSAMLGADLNKIFVQYQAKDINMQNFFHFAPWVMGIYISFLGVSFLVMTNVVSLLPEEVALFGQIFPGLYIGFTIGIIAAFPLTGIYIPLSTIVKDARLMQIKNNGTVVYGGSRVVGCIKGFFSISGLLAGFSYVSGLYDNLLLSIVVYIAILAALVVISFPVLYPTLFIYSRNHAKIVNELRMVAAQNGIAVAETAGNKIPTQNLKKILETAHDTNH